MKMSLMDVMSTSCTTSTGPIFASPALPDLRSAVTKLQVPKLYWFSEIASNRLNNLCMSCYAPRHAWSRKDRKADCQSSDLGATLCANPLSYTLHRCGKTATLCASPDLIFSAANQQCQKRQGKSILPDYFLNFCAEGGLTLHQKQWWHACWLVARSSASGTFLTAARRMHS